MKAKESPKPEVRSPKGAAGFKRDLYVAHTISCVEWTTGTLRIETTRCLKERTRQMTDEQLRAKLKALVGFEPADLFGHVIQQLRLGRTYLVRRCGKSISVEFADSAHSR